VWIARSRVPRADAIDSYKPRDSHLLADHPPDNIPAVMSPVSVPTTTQAVSASTSLTRVVNWDGKSQDIKQALTTAFDANDYLDCIKNLEKRGIDPSSYIDSLDKIIDILQADPDLQKRCIRALRKTCGIYGVLPTSHTVRFKFTKPGQRPFASGGFSDVWRVSDERNRDRMFAVKSLRVYEVDPVEKINKKYCKEVIVCKRVKHPNVLSIEGVAPKLFEFCMVSQWMVNGNLLSYVEKYVGANRLELLVGVTRGLSYLHENEVVHGDLKSPNILMDAKGIPRLSDFGLCSVTRNIESVNASTPHQGCTIRYCAPELLDVGNAVKDVKRKPTNKSDVYSLSMVIVELATGKMPFPDYTDHNVTIMISKGKRPSKPSRFEAPGISSGVWKVAKKCWHEKPKERLESREILQHLENLFHAGGCTHDACSCLPWEVID